MNERKIVVVHVWALSSDAIALFYNLFSIFEKWSTRTRFVSFRASYIDE